MRLLCLVVLSVLLSFSVEARTVEDRVQDARTAIEEGDFERATTLLDEAEAYAPESPIPVTREGLRNIAFYRGVLDHYLGEGVASGYPTDSTMNFFRQALAHDLGFEWDRSLVNDPDGDIEYVFQQLRDEVSSRNQAASGVPLEGVVRVFVDGAMVSADDFIIHGRHLVQVMCPDSRVLGEWVEFGDSPDFGCMCGDELCFESSETTSKPVVQKERSGSLNVAAIVMGSGAALLTGGAITHFAAVSPTYAEIEAARLDPHSINRAAADELTQKFNLQRTLSLGLYVGGALAVGAGGGMLVMDSVVLHPTGSGLGLSGSF